MTTDLIKKTYTKIIDTHPKIKHIIETHGQMIFNIYLFLTFSIWCTYQTYQTYKSGNLDYVEITFAIQNLILVFLLLVRKNHQNVDNNFFNQSIAIIAFCSGVFFMGQEPTGSQLASTISKYVVFAANILGILTLLNLGRSFGILIAFRKIKTNKLYSIVRHPMYGTDILLRIGFLISHSNVFTVCIFILSTACYIYRAILEERFLCLQTNYHEYMEKVHYRFIPFVF